MPSIPPLATRTRVTPSSLPPYPTGTYTWQVHAADELAQISQGHQPGERLESMLRGIEGMHASIREANPRWLLDLLRQLPQAAGGHASCGMVKADGDPHAGVGVGGVGGERVHLSELRALAHRSGPWWI